MATTKKCVIVKRIVSSLGAMRSIATMFRTNTNELHNVTKSARHTGDAASEIKSGSEISAIPETHITAAMRLYRSGRFLFTSQEKNGTTTQ